MHSTYIYIFSNEPLAYVTIIRIHSIRILNFLKVPCIRIVSSETICILLLLILIFPYLCNCNIH